MLPYSDVMYIFTYRENDCCFLINQVPLLLKRMSIPHDCLLQWYINQYTLSRKNQQCAHPSMCNPLNKDELSLLLIRSELHFPLND